MSERQPEVAGEWKAKEVKDGDEEIKKTKETKRKKQKGLDQPVLNLCLVQTRDAGK